MSVLRQFPPCIKSRKRPEEHEAPTLVVHSRGVPGVHNPFTSDPSYGVK